MKVYVIIDTDPQEMTIKAVHSTPLGAFRHIQSLKKEDECGNQFLESTPFEVLD